MLIKRKHGYRKNQGENWSKTADRQNLSEMFVRKSVKCSSVLPERGKEGDKSRRMETEMNEWDVLIMTSWVTRFSIRSSKRLKVDPTHAFRPPRLRATELLALVQSLFPVLSFQIFSNKKKIYWLSPLFHLHRHVCPCKHLGRPGSIFSIQGLTLKTPTLKCTTPPLLAALLCAITQSVSLLSHFSYYIQDHDRGIMTNANTTYHEFKISASEKTFHDHNVLHTLVFSFS